MDAPVGPDQSHTQGGKHTRASKADQEANEMARFPAVPCRHGGGMHSAAQVGVQRVVPVALPAVRSGGLARAWRRHAYHVPGRAR